MIVIEENNTLIFTEGDKQLTPQEGFDKLMQVYNTEPAETCKIIDRLIKQYKHDLVVRY